MIHGVDTSRGNSTGRTLKGLATRDTALRELMDDPDCDTHQLSRTYEQFRSINRLVSGWRRLYLRHIRPLLSPERQTSLLDIGSGGGDIACALVDWARADGLALEVTAIDPDPRAHRFATHRYGSGTAVHFRCASSAHLVREGAVFDVVVSNHLLHHLTEREFGRVLEDSLALARTLVLHNDIARSRTAYAAFWIASLAYRGRSFVRVDGLRSIRRSYRRDELVWAATSALLGHWRVVRAFPSRLLLIADSQFTRGGTP